jgi:hypothetical protein
MNIAPRHHFLLGTIVALLTFAHAPAASAQDADQPQPTAPKPKKKPAKKKPALEEVKPTPEETKPASADESTPAAPPASEETKPATPEKKTAHDEGPSGPEVEITDTREDPNTRYYFVGLRYRGTVIPQFLMNLFVDEGATVYSNMFGAEIDMRKGGQSMIPWITYSDYSTGDILFHQKGTDTIAGNYSVVHSNLKMVIIGLDELWSAPIDEAHHFDFEFGFGVGIGIVFGDLFNNWVFEDPNGPLHASTNRTYSQCVGGTVDGSAPAGCNTGDHQNTMTRKVGGYKEPFWFSGGSVPSIFPNVWFPTLGLRYKPIKQLETRLGVGFSLTGFWFGLSADYGLEKPEDKTVKASSSLVRRRDML